MSQHRPPKRPNPNTWDPRTLDNAIAIIRSTETGMRVQFAPAIVEILMEPSAAKNMAAGFRSFADQIEGKSLASEQKQTTAKAVVQ